MNSFDTLAYIKSEDFYSCLETGILALVGLIVLVEYQNLN
jgi:hypothetical protein